MQVPLEISFHGIDLHQGLHELVASKLGTLERTCGHISSCRVAVEQPQHHRRNGNAYRVRIEMNVPPSHSVVVVHESLGGPVHEQMEAAVREAFVIARRRLQKLVELQRGDTKRHLTETDESVALVVRLFPAQDYGFIKRLDGTELYFHRNGVLHDNFERLELGTAVRFTEHLGHDGPQASSVEIVDKPGARASRKSPPEAEPPIGWR